MAADGSLKFDTKINVKGFEEGISTLSKAMDRLTKAVDRLSSNILSRFNGAGQAVAETTQSAEMTSDAVESIGDAADKSAEQIKSLQEQMDAISVHAMQDTASDTAQSFQHRPARNPLIMTLRLWLRYSEMQLRKSTTGLMRSNNMVTRLVWP